MNILERFFTKRQVRGLAGNTPAPTAPAYPGGINWRNIASTAVRIDTPDLAMSIAAVYRCVSILSGTIASMPVNVKRRKPDGYYYEDTDDSFDLGLNRIFRRQANRRQTSFDLMQNAVSSVLLHGNAYLLPRYRRGGMSELLLISPYCCHYDVLRNVYTVNDAVNGINGEFPASGIVHLRNKSLDGGYTGVSTITYASRVLSIAGSADSQALDGFSNNSRIKGIVTGGTPTNPTFGQFAFDELKTAAKGLNEALSRDEDIIPLEKGVQFIPLALSPADAQLLESRQYSALDVCRFFGVHPDKVFVMNTANYKASENSQVAYMTDTLQPLISQVEAEVNAKLIPESLFDVVRISLDFSALYQTDPVSRSDYYERMHRIGAMTTNEIRRREGSKPIDGGDTPFLTRNLAPIGSTALTGEPPRPEIGNAEPHSELPA